MPVNHPTINTSGLENALADGSLEVSVLDASTVNRCNTNDLSGRLMGLVERNVSAAKEAATKGSEDGGSVRVWLSYTVRVYRVGIRMQVGR